MATLKNFQLSMNMIIKNLVIFRERGSFDLLTICKTPLSETLQIILKSDLIFYEAHNWDIFLTKVCIIFNPR